MLPTHAISAEGILSMVIWNCKIVERNAFVIKNHFIAGF